MLANKFSSSYRLIYLLLGFVPLLLLIITLTKLDLNFIRMFLLTATIYIALYIIQLKVVYRKMEGYKGTKIVLWLLLAIVTFPLGCLLLLIINWKAFQGSVANISL